MNSQRRKGIQAEREVAAWFNDELGYSAKRTYNLGTHEDTGDVTGIPDTCVQVANYADLDRAVREKLPQLEAQMVNMDARFGALFCRRRGGRYVVVQSPAMFATLLREAA